MRFQVKVIILIVKNNYNQEKQIAKGPRSWGEADPTLKAHHPWQSCRNPLSQSLTPILEYVHTEIFFTSGVREHGVLVGLMDVLSL